MSNTDPFDVDEILPDLDDLDPDLSDLLATIPTEPLPAPRRSSTPSRPLPAPAVRDEPLPAAAGDPEGGPPTDSEGPDDQGAAEMETPSSEDGFLDAPMFEDRTRDVDEPGGEVADREAGFDDRAVEIPIVGDEPGGPHDDPDATRAFDVVREWDDEPDRAPDDRDPARLFGDDVPIELPEDGDLETRLSTWRVKETPPPSVHSGPAPRDIEPVGHLFEAPYGGDGRGTDAVLESEDPTQPIPAVPPTPHREDGEGEGQSPTAPDPAFGGAEASGGGDLLTDDPGPGVLFDGFGPPAAPDAERPPIPSQTPTVEAPPPLDRPVLPRIPLGEMDGFGRQLGQGLVDDIAERDEVAGRRGPASPAAEEPVVEEPAVEAESEGAEDWAWAGDDEEIAVDRWLEEGDSGVESDRAAVTDASGLDDGWPGPDQGEGFLGGPDGAAVAAVAVPVGATAQVGEVGGAAWAPPAPADMGAAALAPTPGEWAARSFRPVGSFAPCTEETAIPAETVTSPFWRRHLGKLAALLVVAVGTAVLLTVTRDEATEEDPATAELRALGDVVGEVSEHTSIVAEAAIPLLDVYTSPDDPAPVMSLEHPTEVGAPLVFLVQEQRGEWLRVLLPVRPNGSSGWIRVSDVVLTKHDFRVVVSLSEHRLDLYQGGEIKMTVDVAVGSRDTPTPGGTFYIKELLKPPNPDTIYGNFAFGLSGFSNVLENFNKGEGVIGIHGTNDPSVIGQDVSAGCIRLANDDMLDLVGKLPLGTPVDILA